MDTIAAISTALGTGGIGIIRLSGKESFKIIDKIFKPKNRSEIKSNNIKYGYIVKGETIIDEVLVSYFKAPKSYTTEDMCEINSHGGSIIMKQILELCLENGANLAEPGEFTKRAFLNGRIDLSQAEAVIDIINAKTEKEAKASINQLQGGLSTQIKEIENQLLDILSDIEATIDYPEYDIEEITEDKIKNILIEVNNKLDKLSKSFDNGKIIKEGIKTAIIGKPNVGKSSLLNTILQEDRAIVTEYEGTTRDTIEEFISIEGIPIKIIDTAGIRDTANEVEKIGIEKSYNIINQADLIIAIFDASREMTSEDYEILKLINNKTSIIILNKIDKPIQVISDKIADICNSNKTIINMSMIEKQGIEELYNTIIKMFKLNQIEVGQDIVITNVRHKEIIIKTQQKVQEVLSNLNQNTPIDILSIKIKESLEELGEITGSNATDDIIKKIFSKFCLGK